VFNLEKALVRGHFADLDDDTVCDMPHEAAWRAEGPLTASLTEPDRNPLSPTRRTHSATLPDCPRPGTGGTRASPSVRPRGRHNRCGAMYLPPRCCHQSPSRLDRLSLVDGTLVLRTEYVNRIMPFHSEMEKRLFTFGTSELSSVYGTRQTCSNPDGRSATRQTQRAGT
jgi:hypothetical protein